MAEENRKGSPGMTNGGAADYGSRHNQKLSPFSTRLWIDSGFSG
jgi:hypothetical protein